MRGPILVGVCAAANGPDGAESEVPEVDDDFEEADDLPDIDDTPGRPTDVYEPPPPQLSPPGAAVLRALQDGTLLSERMELDRAAVDELVEFIQRADGRVA